MFLVGLNLVKCLVDILEHRISEDSIITIIINNDVPYHTVGNIVFSADHWGWNAGKQPYSDEELAVSPINKFISGDVYELVDRLKRNNKLTIPSTTDTGKDLFEISTENGHWFNVQNQTLCS